MFLFIRPITRSGSPRTWRWIIFFSTTNLNRMARAFHQPRCCQLVSTLRPTLKRLLQKQCTTWTTHTWVSLASSIKKGISFICFDIFSFSDSPSKWSLFGDKTGTEGFLYSETNLNSLPAKRPRKPPMAEFHAPSGICSWTFHLLKTEKQPRPPFRKDIALACD